MDNQRIFLYGALGLLLLLIWQTWQMDYGARPEAERERPAEVAEREDDTPAAEIDAADAPAIDEDAPDTADGERPGIDDETIPAVDRGLPQVERIQVLTDRLDVTLDLYGGDLREANLRTHMQAVGSDRPIQLLSDDPDRLFVAQSGLQAADRDAPTHHARFRADQTRFNLQEGQDELRVPLYWQGEDMEVVKTYIFHRDSYVIDVEFEVRNLSDEAWIGRQYRQLQRYPRAGDNGTFLIPTFQGVGYYSDEDKYTRIAFDDIADEGLNRRVQGGWVAVVEHYFVSAWIPDATDTNTFYTRSLDNGTQQRHIIGMYSGSSQIRGGESGTFHSRLYLGPKEQDRLSPVAEGLNLTVDYGYMTLLAQPLFWVLNQIHSFVGNWGLAIILLTLMIKLVFYKLSETSFKSMARMRNLQPKVQQIRERFGDDREKMGRAMMDLYKKEKVNPLGGCLPILVQIPVFIALFWMLLGSVELRHAEFGLWIQDLSARDPYFILPVLMGISMWLQQKLNPTPPDPLQQKIFMALPFVFTVFFSFFPSGLVLYWLTNNVLSIAQQYYITKYVVGDKLAPRKPAKSKEDGPEAIEHADPDHEEEASVSAEDEDEEPKKREEDRD